MAERPQFIDQIQRKWAEDKFVEVGLDPDYSKLPPHLREQLKKDGSNNFNLRAETTLEFLVQIVDATADLVCAYKPNLAAFAEMPSMERTLKKIVDYIHAAHPDIPVIGDGKRADIGKTNQWYAKELFAKYGFDATTTNPYFGQDTYTPFLEYQGKGLIALCKTSNPASHFYQDSPINLDFYQRTQRAKNTPLTDEELELAEKAANQYFEDYIAGELTPQESEESWRKFPEGKYLPLYQLVALRTATLAKTNPNIGIVVGATHPEAFIPTRILVGNTTILIPGIGTQGGDLEKTMKYAPNQEGEGFIINSSSGILFASNKEDFAEAARNKTIELHEQIKQLRAV